MMEPCFDRLHVCRPFARSSRTAAGWALAEALVALGVLGIGIGGVVALNSRVLLQLRSTHQTALATHAVQERVDGIRRATWAQITDSGAIAAALLVNPNTAGTTLPGFVEQVNVVDYPPTGAASNSVRRNANGSTTVLSTNTTQRTETNAVAVTIRTQWTGANGSTRMRETLTIMAKGGIER